MPVTSTSSDFVRLCVLYLVFFPEEIQDTPCYLLHITLWGIDPQKRGKNRPLLELLLEPRQFWLKSWSMCFRVCCQPGCSVALPIYDDENLKFDIAPFLMKGGFSWGYLTWFRKGRIEKGIKWHIFNAQHNDICQCSVLGLSRNCHWKAVFNRVLSMVNVQWLDFCD